MYVERTDTKVVENNLKEERKTLERITNNQNNNEKKKCEVNVLLWHLMRSKNKRKQLDLDDERTR